MDKSLVFSLGRFPGPDNFCSRDEELNLLLSLFKNRKDAIVYGHKGIGKTGFIQQFQHSLAQQKKLITVYIDTLETKSISDFVNKLIETCVLALVEKSQGFGKKALKTFAQLRPNISSIDVINFSSFQLELNKLEDINLSLELLESFILKSKYKFQIAIDEFQSISNFKESSFLFENLRHSFKDAKNIHFLFSFNELEELKSITGKKNEVLISDIELIELKYLDEEDYSEFITKQFKKIRKTITDAAVNEILEWTNGHTFYTQYVCNRLQTKSNRKITIEIVDELKNEVLYQYGKLYINLRKLLRRNQWDLLVAIAKEGTVTEYTSKEFLSKYTLAQSSAKQAIESLVAKSILLKIKTAEKAQYQVYDVFLWRWIEKYG